MSLYAIIIYWCFRSTCEARFFFFFNFIYFNRFQSAAKNEYKNKIKKFAYDPRRRFIRTNNDDLNCGYYIVGLIFMRSRIGEIYSPVLLHAYAHYPHRRVWHKGCVMMNYDPKINPYSAVRAINNLNDNNDYYTK